MSVRDRRLEPTPEIATNEYHQRFWARIDQRGPDECWEWMRGQTTAGYGCVRWRPFGGSTRWVDGGVVDAEHPERSDPPAPSPQKGVT